ncbi:hypothetical protein N9F02_05255 [Polaribacter sp.]|nr:hypothetical protein [Polaribacter sp.]
MNTLIYKQESCTIIGICIRVQNQTLNNLAASKVKLGLHVNFGEDHLTSKRTVL